MQIEPGSNGAGLHTGRPGNSFRGPAHRRHDARDHVRRRLENPPHGIVGGTRAPAAAVTSRIAAPDFGGTPQPREPYAWIRTRLRSACRPVGAAGAIRSSGTPTPCARSAGRLDHRRDGNGGLCWRFDDHGLDAVATKARRRTLLSERLLPLVSPAGPGASTWTRDDMRAGNVYLLNPDEE